jgi:hypothetical protein
LRSSAWLMTATPGLLVPQSEAPDFIPTGAEAKPGRLRRINDRLMQAARECDHVSLDELAQGGRPDRAQPNFVLVVVLSVITAVGLPVNTPSRGTVRIRCHAEDAPHGRSPGRCRQPSKGNWAVAASISELAAWLWCNGILGDCHSIPTN